jgi:uncharacterized protein
MKNFRKNVAFAFDGGGLRGVITASALNILESALNRPVHEITGLSAGTSTGSIIAAAVAAKLTAKQILELYVNMGQSIFKKSARTMFWPLTTFRYPRPPLAAALERHIGNMKMSDVWNSKPSMDLVVTTFDLVENRSRFIKSWKDEYKDWRVIDAVQASAAAPTYFSVLNGRYTDGGVGSYNNPCYLAAYEILRCLNWKPEETTLISLGTGRPLKHMAVGEATKFRPLQWLSPLLDAFGRSADDQQVHLVDTFFNDLDFRRFQVDMKEEIALDDSSQIDAMLEYGERMGSMILSDQYDRSMGVVAAVAPLHAN